MRLTCPAGLAPGAWAELMALRGGSAGPAVSVRQGPPLIPARLRVGETLAAVHGAIGVAVSDLHHAAEPLRISVDRRHAEAALWTDRFTGIEADDGQIRPAPVPDWMATMMRMTQPWPTSEGRYFLPHLNLEHLRSRVLSVLGAQASAESVAAAVARWTSDALDAAIAEVGACGAPVRTEAEWLAHPHGALLAARPPVRITRIGDAPPEPLPGGGRVLSGLRVLDLTRILAGPITARTLAEHGAEVLMITAPHLPQADHYVRDTSHGKRSAWLDLDGTEDRERLSALAARADVFSQGYRPGALAARGFGPEDLARLRPGIVHVSISCYSSGGAVSHRAGWEQVAQCATGAAAANGGKGLPTLIPAPVCDYLTGYLGAFGALCALHRRSIEGGSWHVEVSLCQSAMLLVRQGTVDAARAATPLSSDEIERFSQMSDTVYGRLRHLRPVPDIPGAPPCYARPSPKLGMHPPLW